MKKLIKYLDNQFFQRRIANWLDVIQMRTARGLLLKSFKYNCNIAFDNQTSLLNMLSEKYGSDKGSASNEPKPYKWPSHTYTEIYDLLFQLSRFNINNVLECGIGTNNPNLPSTMGEKGKPGASLRMWRDYFPNAEIFGIDIDKNILFTEDRISCFQVDQCDQQSIRKFLKETAIKDRKFDVIIDDGLHTFDAGISLLSGLLPKLGDEGIYVIEDVTPADYVKFVNYFDTLKEKLHIRFVDLYRPDVRIDCNRMIIINKIIV